MEYTELCWKEVPCNECNSKEDVKTIRIGSLNVILCKECRESLSELLLK